MGSKKKSLDYPVKVREKLGSLLKEGTLPSQAGSSEVKEVTLFDLFS